MSLDRVVDEMIRDAMARGEFDNLPGAGKPQDLDSYFAAPEDLRMAWSVLRNAGYLPEEVQLMKDIAALRARLAAAPSDAERVKLKKELDEKVLGFNVLMEQRQRARRAARRR
jgi:hypothetical protein